MECFKGLLQFLIGVFFYIDDVNPFLSEGEVVTPPVDVPVTPTDVAMGDVNEDGVVDAKDALDALKISVNKMQPTEKQKAAADVTEDKSIDARDALEILKYSVGKASVVDKFYK